MAATLRPGDVVRYEPQSRWCHDGIAIAEARGDRLMLLDTYWVTDRKVVQPDDYEVLFNLSDYTETTRGAWEEHSPADRQVINRHSGYQPIFLVRNGSSPDLSTKIANAQERVADAEEKVRSAQWSLECARRELALLESGASRD